MQEDMYSYIDNQKKKKKKKTKADRSIVLIIALVTVFFLGVAFIFGRIFFQRFQFRNFTSVMSSATSHGTLSAEYDDEVSIVTKDHTYALYQIFTQNQAKPRKDVPDSEVVFLLTYGNGSVMECWEVPLENHVQRKSGICWRFTAANGKVWIYDTDDFGYNDIWRLVNADSNKRLSISN